MTYAFYFDASACTGCKACQAACKDKNGLPVGVFWRRVIEVSGGEWHPAGGAWQQNIFAYNLSLACNHCIHPKCAGVCPVDAYTVRPDGVVLLDSSRCMGCGYCAWACPYGAPQYLDEQGIMTKCDLCYDNLDAGLPPSCVAACPLRILNCIKVEGLPSTEGSQALWQVPAVKHPFPLADDSRTEPRLVIKPHPGMESTLKKMVANREEIEPSLAKGTSQPANLEELPLVIFTLLAQMAAGLAIYGLVVSPLPQPLMLAIGILLGAGGAASFLHLGRKRNAWRVLFNLKKSWLSREVLMAFLLAASWLVTISLAWAQIPFSGSWLMAVSGLGLVYCMSRVYRLHAIPVWDTWRTPAAFFLSTAALGALGVDLFAPGTVWAVIAGLALCAELGMALTAGKIRSSQAGGLRLALLGMGLCGILLLGLTPLAGRAWLPALVLLITLAEETIGRYQFYAGRSRSHF